MNWVKTYYTFISAFKDSLIIFIIYSNEFSKIIDRTANILIVLSLIIYWLLLNYILGQYEISYEESKNKLLSNVVNTLLAVITTNFINITINLITDHVNFNVVDFFLFNNITYKIFLYILISQSLIDPIIQKRYFKRGKS